MKKQTYEQLEEEAFNFYHYYTQKNILPSKKKKLKQRWLNALKKSGWTKREFEQELLKRTEI